MKRHGPNTGRKSSVLLHDLRPTGPAILPPVGPTGPPKYEIYA